MRLALALAACGVALCPPRAQTYPSRQIELVVPFVAGGTTDTVARLIAQRLSDRWGQPAIVSNRPGGGSIDRHQQVAKAAPDGHTADGHHDRLRRSTPACRSSPTTR